MRSVQSFCRRATSRRFQRTGCGGVARRSSVPCLGSDDPGDPRRLESSARRAGTPRPIRIGRGRNRKIPSFERTRHPGSLQTGQEPATPASRFSPGERSTRTTVGAASGLKEPRTVWGDRSKRGGPQWALPACFRSKVGGPLQRSLGDRSDQRSSNGQALQAALRCDCRLRIPLRSFRWSLPPHPAARSCSQCQPRGRFP